MNSLEAIRTTLAIAASTVDGVQGYSYIPPQVNPPCAVIAPDSVVYFVNFEGDATYRVPLQLLVSLGDWESAHRSLDSLCAHDGPMVTAIHSCSLECSVTEMGEYGLVTYGDKEYLGAVLVVEVFVG